MVTVNMPHTNAGLCKAACLPQLLTSFDAAGSLCGVSFA